MTSETTEVEMISAYRAMQQRIGSLRTSNESVFTAATAVASGDENPRSEVDAAAQLHIHWMQHLLNSAHCIDADKRSIEET